MGRSIVRHGSVSEGRRALLLLGLVLLLAAGLRLPGLGDDALWYDEQVTAVEVDQPSLRDTWRAARRHDASTPPLFPVVLHAWARAAGHSEWALRLPSVLAGLLGVAFTWAAGRRWLGAGPAAVVAASLAATAPVLVYYAREARAYSAAFALAALGGWLVARAMDDPGPRRVLAACLAAALLVLTHYSGYWVVAAWCAALLLIGALRLAAALAATIAATLPVPLLYTQWGASQAQTAWLAGLGPLDALRGIGWLDLPNPAPLDHAAGGAFLVLAAVLAVVLGRAGRSGDARPGAALFLWAWLAGPLLGPALAGWFVGRPLGGLARYVLVGLPALFLLLGWGIGRAAPRGAFAITTLLCVGLAHASLALLTNPIKPDWRGVVRRLDQAPAGEVFLVWPGYETIGLEARMPGHGDRIHGLPEPGPMRDEAVARLAGASAVWLVQVGDRAGDAAPIGLADGWRPVSEEDRVGIRLRRLLPLAGSARGSGPGTPRTPGPDPATRRPGAQ